MKERDTLKHYRLLDRIGEGGMGVVYRAEDTRLGRTVALKMLHHDVGADPERSRRFEREARIISAMNHPGIATLYDFDHEGDVAFLAMEFVKGPTLRQLLEQGPLPMSSALECAVQVAEALAAAHKEGVIHRDLKPENIMMSESGYYKVLDFGVARRNEAASRDTPPGTRMPTISMATVEGMLLGTLTYMSPEQVMGQPVDGRSDIFAFGSLLYEVVTGRPAFRGNNEIAVAHAVAYDKIEPMRNLRPEVPAALERVVQRCLGKKPEQRYATAEQLAADLRFIRLDALSGNRTPGGLRGITIGRRPVRWWWIGGAAVLIAAAVLAVNLIRAPGPAATQPATVPGSGPEAVTPVSHGGRPRVIVAFFENNSGDAEADWLSRGLPEMLTTDLSRSPGLDVIATQRLYDLLALSGKEDRQGLDRSTTAELARWAGADVVVSGSVFKAGDRFRIDAQGYDTSTGTVLVAHKVEGSELFRMVEELTDGLRQGLKVGEVGEKGLQGLTTSSPEAFRLYARGKEMYDRLSYGEAADAFRSALALDPAFAVARLRLAMSLYAGGDEEAALPLIDASMAEADRMPEPERRMTRALHAYLSESRFAEGTAQLEELVRRFPNTKEAYVWWARALIELENDPLRATRKLREVIDQDANYLPALEALAAQLADLGELEHVQKMLDDALARNPDAEPALSRLIEEYRPS